MFFHSEITYVCLQILLPPYVKCFSMSGNLDYLDQLHEHAKLQTQRSAVGGIVT